LFSRTAALGDIGRCLKSSSNCNLFEKWFKEIYSLTFKLNFMAWTRVCCSIRIVDAVPVSSL
jgi:hypothetical protein